MTNCFRFALLRHTLHVIILVPAVFYAGGAMAEQTAEKALDVSNLKQLFTDHQFIEPKSDTSLVALAGRSVRLKVFMRSATSSSAKANEPRPRKDLAYHLFVSSHP